MKAFVDKDTCISCGQCTCTCPEVFSMDDDGKAVAINAEINSDLQSSAENACDGCPVDAISIE